MPKLFSNQVNSSVRCLQGHSKREYFENNTPILHFTSSTILIFLEFEHVSRYGIRVVGTIRNMLISEAEKLKCLDFSIFFQKYLLFYLTFYLSLQPI